MSIQFNCGSCSQSLKVPDGSSGKKVKCPQCESVNIIPEPESESAPSVSEPVPAVNPFSSPPAAPSSATENPFAAPLSELRGSPTGIAKHTIQLADVFEQTWRRFRPQLGPAILFSLILAAIGAVTAVIGVVTSMVAALIPVIGILVATAVYLAFGVASAYMQCISKRFAINVARGAPDPLQRIFPFEPTMKLVLFFVLTFVVTGVVGLLAMIPAGIGALIDGGEGTAAAIGFMITVVLGAVVAIIGVVLTMRLFLTLHLIVDRNLDVFDAIRQSNELMKGNSLTTWVTMLLAGILMSLVGTITCGLGYLVAGPFILTMQAVIYLKITGQYQDIPA